MERRDEELVEWNVDAMSETEREEALAIEAALRSYYAQENAVASTGARASFATVHQTLMNEIESDVSALDIASQEHGEPQMIVPAFTGLVSPALSRETPKSKHGGRSGVWGLSLGRLMGMASVALIAAWGGHYIGRSSTSAATFLPNTAPSSLPVQSLENDFDKTLSASTPIEFVSDNGDQAASWLSQQTGRTVRLPALRAKPENQLKLLGASRRSLGGLEAQAVVQAHYQLPNGTRVTLYQVRAPHLGLVGLRKESIKGNAFFVKRDGRFRTVVWRSGDDWAAIVSPLGTQQSLRLAASLRAAQPSSMI